ncbi:MAG: integrase core domain-containing protein [Rhodospirillales bacterium]|nr:integrase core domain-containing protein [Rhodospirillales bacterium]
MGWLKAGIALERIDPGQPQQNGRHERMHKTLKAETAKPPAASKEQQQLRFDRFRKDFNEYRPHEALGQQPPAAFYHPSPRPWPERPAEPWYDPWHAVRRVRIDGSIKWGDHNTGTVTGQQMLAEIGIDPRTVISDVRSAASTSRGAARSR